MSQRECPAHSRCTGEPFATQVARLRYCTLGNGSGEPLTAASPEAPFSGPASSSYLECGPSSGSISRATAGALGQPQERGQDNQHAEGHRGLSWAQGLLSMVLDVSRVVSLQTHW